MKRNFLYGWLAALFLTGPVAADQISELQAALTKQAAQLVDVRELSEWNAGHIAGALHLPLSELERAKTLPAVLKKDQPVYLYCRSGRRSAVAAGILKKQGYDARSLTAGYEELKRQGITAAKPSGK
jgi:rhodanese-related sulfurtransferase